MIPKKVVQQVLDRDQWLCVIAGPNCLGAASCADHRVGRGMGGNKGLDRVENLVAACGPCNGDRESNPGLAAALEVRGILLRRSATTKQDLTTARTRTVKYPDESWWFLLPDGTRQRCEDPPF